MAEQQRQQSTFDFNRAARIAWLKKIPLQTKGPGLQMLLTLEDYLGENPSCYPSMKRLAQDCRVSPDTARRVLHELAELGLIRITPRFRDMRQTGTHSGQTSNLYSFNWSLISDLAGSIVPEQPAKHIARIVTPLARSAHPLARCEAPPCTVPAPPWHGARPYNHPLNQENKTHENHGGKFSEGKDGQGKKGVNWGRKLKADELRQPHTIERLYSEAVRRGWIESSAAARLRFHALARYAVRKATINPPGLFNAVFFSGAWHYIASVDEDSARAGIERLDAGEPRERPGSGLPAQLFSMPRHATAGVSDENES